MGQYTVCERLCDTLGRFQAAVGSIAASDDGGQGDGEKRDVGDGIEVFGGISVSNPETLLSRTLEAGVVAFALSPQGIN